MQLDYFLSAFQSEQDLALTFQSQHNGLYKYTKKYYFHYDDDTALWTEIEEDDIINSFSLWIIHNASKFIAQTTNKETREQLMNIIEKKCKYQFLKNVMHFFNVFIKDDQFINKLDRIKNDYLPIKNNQVVNLKTGEVEYRTKDHYFTYFCDVEPTEQQSEMFNNFINQIMCNNKDNVKYLQKILGYCMTGDTKAQSFFIFWGSGSNGKSLLLKLLDKLLDKAYKPASKKLFIASNKEAGPEMIDIKNARLITFSETKMGDKLNDDFIKSITGNDKITARALYRDPVTFTLISKLILCTNYKPEFNGMDKAMNRRIHYVPFNASFVNVPTKPNQFLINRELETLLPSEYLNEFFTFCLNGAIEYYKDTKLSPPKEIKKEQDKYLLSQNSAESWFLERIQEKEGCKINRADCFPNYFKFCEDKGITPLKKFDFLEMLVNYLGETKKINGAYIYKNFKLKENDDDEDNNDNDNDNNQENKKSQLDL